MLQMVLDGQVSIRKEMQSEFKKVNRKMDKGFKKVNGRIDKIGSQLAYLEDDSPTRKEHDKLEKRVTVIEHSIAWIN